MLSYVDSVHSGGSFPFLHRGRVFLIRLRGTGVALKVNKDRFRKEKRSSYIGRAISVVD